MTGALRHIARAPFTRRAWAELAYVIITFPLALAAVAFIIPMLVNGALWGASAPGVRKFGAASRFLARALLGEDVPAPQPLQRYPYVRVRTPEAVRLTALVSAAGALVRPRGQDIVIMGLPASRIANLAAENRIAIHAMRPQRTSWLRGAIRDRAAQAQLVALAMKLGLAKDKLTDTAPPDLTRVAQLVGDAHRSAIEAIAELRTLARGIHPTVLDNGLADALATLAARSALPVELITDIPERPSAAIETIAYFCAAELLANVAKHSGARHATLEAVHVPGLLRIRVTDDGRGGAAPVPDGGLRGLAERIRTVDGGLDIDSPAGGPTAVTVELPSHA